MSLSRHVSCEDCGGSFWQTIERRSDPYPDECPLCADAVIPWNKRPKMSPNIAKMVEEGRGPATGNAYAKAGDKVYRDLEASSAHQSVMAAQALGVDPSETAHMKVTNMKDGMKAGETSAILPPNPVADAMARGQNTGFVANPTGPGGQKISLGTSSGIVESVRQGIVANHQNAARSVVKRGEEGRYGTKR